MPEEKRVLDVGQCGVDGPRLGRFLSRQLKCVVDRAHTKGEAVKLAGENAYDLVLVNRVLDRDRSAGVEVIAELHKLHPDLRLMLVSDLPEAQAEAQKAGAMEGFGKYAMESAETEGYLRAVLGEGEG